MLNFAFYRPGIAPHFCIVKENSFIPYLMSKYIFTIALFIAAQSLFGQGWERIYTGGGNDEAYDVEITPDGGYILAGFYGGSNVNLVKVDVDGFLQWSKFGMVQGPAQALALEIAPDSSYYVAGWRGNDDNRNGLLFKTNFNGEVLWSKQLGVAGEDVFNDLVLLPNGNVVLVGSSTQTKQMRVVLTDADGNEIWSQLFGLTDLSYEERGYDVVLADNGDIVVSGVRRKTSSEEDIYVVRLTPNGTLVWEQVYSISATAMEQGYGLCKASDGDFVIAGSLLPGVAPDIRRGFVMKISETGDPIPEWYKTYPQKVEQLNDVETDGGTGFLITGRTPELAGVKNDLFIARLDLNGDIIWENGASKSGLTEGYAVSVASNGGFVAVGYAATTSNPFSPHYAYMVRTDANGKIFTNYLEGTVFNDGNDDCTLQGGEPSLNNWLLRISSPDFTRYTTTDNTGRYFIMVDTGDYEIKVFPPNNYWATCNNGPLTVSVNTFYDTLTANVGIAKEQTCPYNEVDIQTPILRRCANNTYTVRYCNSGTVASQNTTVTVTKSPDLAIVSASVPYLAQGDSLIFNVGALTPGNCGSFEIVAFLDCNVDLSSAHCMRAHITPDTFCGTGTGWDRAIIKANANCVDGKVRLSVSNIGAGDIAHELEYVIVEDIIVLFAPPSGAAISGLIDSLKVNEDTLVYERPANGKTYRIIAEQTDGYPGMSVPTAAVEGCQTDTTPIVTTGFYTMFPEDDAEPFVAADCQEAYEANFNPDFLKRGHPKGYKEPHYIKPETEIDYLIHFQNTGSDTVHQVIVRDTLSPWLDPASVRPGTASHAYTYTVYGDGIVQFNLLNINLTPSGSSNSEGYVKFRVSQKPDLPCETQIYNRAAIWYDFNAPVLTNETFHTVCDSFVEVAVATKNIHFPGADIKVFPNPFVESTTFEVTGVSANDFYLEVYDAQGRAVFNQYSNHSTFRLSRNQLPTGFLYYRLAADGKPVASGVLLVR